MNRNRAMQFLLSLLFFSAIAQANVVAVQKSYYPADFYAGLENGLRGADLKAKLFAILSQVHVPGSPHDTIKARCGAGDTGCYQHTVLGYTRARAVMFGEIHLQTTSDGYGVYDVYCQHMASTRDFKTRPPGPGQIPDAAVVNTEHTWPQSRFSSAFDKEMQKSDLNILYPVLQQANSSRNNLKYGDVTAVTSQPCPTSKRGHAASGSDDYFEVPAAHKGNAARAVFYFSVRYKVAITADEEASLRAWNRSDPVDEFERSRNETVYQRQHERNPFIDHPELVDLVSDF